MPARYHQLFRHVRQQRVGDTDVAFGVLEVDRVDLVRHGRRAGLAFDFALCEVVDRDVTPHVTIEVEQYLIESKDCVKQLRHVVVRLDLRRQRVDAQSQPIDEAARHIRPIDLGVGDKVCVVVAHGAVELTQQPYRRSGCALCDQPRADVLQLFAQCRRRCRLAMGASEHRHVVGFGGERCDLVDQCLHLGEQDRAAIRQHETVGEVVDVLRRTREVDELDMWCQTVNVADLLLDKVLDGLDVVVGRRFDGFDALGIATGKRFRDRRERFRLRCRQCG